MAEIVTREMVLIARVAYDGAGSHPMRAALLAVAPLIRRAALEEAAECIKRKHTHNLGPVHPMALSDAAAILALAEKRE